MNGNLLRVATAVLLGSTTSANPQDVGDCWREVDGGGDAGSLPGTAQVVEGSGQEGRPDVMCIDGQVSGMGADGPPDLEDMYLIRICNVEDADVVEGGFEAFTVDPGGEDVLDNTILWLFRGFDGAGRVANVKDGDRPPMLEFSRLTAVPTDGSPALASPGLFYLAVTGFPRVAQDGPETIFFFEMLTERSGPDGTCADVQEPECIIDNWMGPPPGIGRYRIILRGVTYGDAPVVDCNGNTFVDWCDIVNGISTDCNGDGIPDECGQCPEDLDGSCAVDFGDILAILTDWGPCPPRGSDCRADLTGDDVVGFADILEVLSAWGPCF